MKTIQGIEHFADEPFIYNGAGGEITAYPCGCGCRPFETQAELDAHIANERMSIEDAVEILAKAIERERAFNRAESDWLERPV